MSRILVSAGCFLIWSCAACLSGQDVLSRPAADALFLEAVSQLRNVQMTADQLAKIRELAGKIGPEIEQAERKADKNGALSHARDEAVAQAVKKGLRGARARELLNHAMTLTDAEQTAFLSATRLRRKFDQAVRDLLTESQKSEIQRTARPAVATSGFIIVQLSMRLPAPPRSAETLDEAAAALNLPRLRELIAKFDLKRSKRAVNPELLDRLAETGNEATDREIRRLRSFWQIDVRGREAFDLALVLQNLRALEEVEDAYAAAGLEEPAANAYLNPSSNPYFHFQRYLDPAPTGIDAPAAWRVAGGKGAGVGLVDLERGWNIDHEDLSKFLHHPVYGDRQPGNDHGTSVLGEMIAEDNIVGVLGAAPCVDYVALTSRYHAFSGFSEPDVANALVAALFFMDPGDILLLEAETKTNFPVEIEPLNYVAIRLAVASRIIVIEAAGNGNHDLDSFRYQGMRILNRSDICFRDSGAILVGASDPANDQNKGRASCYGSRVDCFGWGNYVATTSCSAAGDLINSGEVDDNKCYRSMFNGTSSAAPIVAGAALLVQGLWKRKCGTALTSTEMREILSNPLTGTPQGCAVPGHIGVMPDLKAIIAANGLDRTCPPEFCQMRQSRCYGFVPRGNSIRRRRARYR